MAHRQEQVETLAGLWRAFADNECRGYSPLYEAIATAVADDSELLDLVLEAPPHAHQPLVLLAAVHYLVLEGLEHPLSEVYAGRSEAAAPPLFRQLCFAHRERLLELMAGRRTQTNECGRSAVLALGLAHVAESIGEPLAVVDAGASAGLNLLFDRYRLDYGVHGSLGPAESPVHVECEIHEPSVPLPNALPRVSARMGIDRNPIDLADEADVRWLLACVWPDTGRLRRTAAALDLARAFQPRVVAGDMVEDLPALLAQLDHAATTTVMTSWAYAYLKPSARGRFVEHLVAASWRRPVAWVNAEGLGIVELLTVPEPPADVVPSVLGVVIADRGAVEATTLATVHPHGAWIAGVRSTHG